MIDPNSLPPAPAWTVFDWILVVLLAYSTLRAFMTGLLRELASLLGLIAGILLAAYNYHRVAGQLFRWIKPFTTAEIVAFLLIAFGVMIVFSLVGRALSKTASVIGLGFFDRLFGAAFGLVRGLLLGVAVMIAAAAFLPADKQAEWIAPSRLSPYFLAGAHAVSFVVPRDLRQQITNGGELLLHTGERIRNGLPPLSEPDRNVREHDGHTEPTQHGTQQDKH